MNVANAMGHVTYLDQPMKNQICTSSNIIDINWSLHAETNMTPIYTSVLQYIVQSSTLLTACNI